MDKFDDLFASETTCLDVVDEDNAPRSNCVVDELASGRQVYQDISVVDIFHRNPHVGNATLRELGGNRIGANGQNMRNAPF